MKKFGHILACAAMVCSLAACNSEWLDTEPTNQIGMATIFKTTQLAQTAVNGLSKLMNIAYPYYVGNKLSSTNFCGEGAIRMTYGNYMGNHFVFANRDAYGVLFKGTNYVGNISSIYCYYPWWYYYMVIGNANTIVENIDKADGPLAEKQFIKAQALTYRAYCYTMLAQLYCNRWADSNNGEAQGIVLRTDASSSNLGLCTMKQLYKQIYGDLDEAIHDFSESGLDRKAGDICSPNLSVAYAVYARASLNRLDYATAASMAAKARVGYPLMSNDAYCSGFNKPTSEWLWGSSASDAETLGYYSYFSQIGYNTTNSNYTTRGFCISRELYNQVPKSDIRRSLFLDGEGYAYETNSASVYLGRATPTQPLYKKAFAEHPDMPTAHYVYAYMQFKIKSIDGIGKGSLNYIRSSEMLLIEAEAHYFMGEEEQARKALLALNKESGRDVDYTCTATGEALWKEIKLYRGLELWGEGFDWFDVKRWNEPIVRKTYEEGGNFTNKTGFTTNVDENNRWTWSIPALETDFNDKL